MVSILEKTLSGYGYDSTAKKGDSALILVILSLSKGD